MARISALSCVFLLTICGGLAQEFVVTPAPPETSSSAPQDPQEQGTERSVVENKESCEGCVTKLQVNVDGVSPMLDTAIQDVESERNRKQVLLELIGLERQIVNGVKFGITIKLGSTTCDRTSQIFLTTCPVDEAIDAEYCKVEFLQKPWLSKDKYVISNNCTSKLYEYPETQPSSGREETTTGKPAELTPERIASIESQIIPQGDEDFFDTVYRRIEMETNDLEDGSDRGFPREMHVENDDYYYYIRRKREEQSERVERDLNTSEDSKSNETSIDSSEEKLKRVARDLNTSEDSRSNDTSVSSEEHRRVPRDTTQPQNDEDSITRHKRAADTNDSSSSSSSSSSDDNNDNNDINNNGNDKHKKAKTSKKESLKKNDNNNNNDDNDTSSSSSSDDDDNNNNNNNNNNKHRRKRGTESDHFNEKLLLRNLAKYITAFYDTKDEDDLRQIALSVVQTKRSVIEGLVYNLRLKIASTDCDENKDILRANNLRTYNLIDDDNACKKSLLPDSEKLCKVKIYIPESYTDPKILDSRCHTSSKNKHRNKRQVLVGGISKVSPDDPEIIKLADSTVNLMDGESEHSNKLKIVKIHEASTQVVSGTLYRIKADIVVSDCPKTDQKQSKLCGTQSGVAPKTCDIEIWSQPWLPKGTQTTVKCGTNTQKYRSRRDVDDASHTLPNALSDDQADFSTNFPRNKREVLVGGISKVSPDDPEIIKLADSTVNLMDGESEHSNKLKIVKIHEASTQVVSGTLYRIKADIVVSDCPKTDQKQSKLCGTQSGVTPKTCDIEIWSQPWLPKGTQTTVKCGTNTQKYRSKRDINDEVPVLGGISKVSPDDSGIVKLADSTVNLMDGESEHSNKLKIVKIHEASRQVVSGTLYRIKADIVVSDCPKTDSKQSKLCGTQSGATPKTCDIEIWSQSWLPKGTQTTVKCGTNTQKYRSRRDIGDALHVAPNALAYTMDTLHLMDEQSKFPTKWKPVRLMNSIKQGEGHPAYTINILLGLSVCPKDSDVDVIVCPLDPHYPVVKCKLLVWDNLSSFRRDVLRAIKCENGLRASFGPGNPLAPGRKKRQVGVPVPESTSDPTIVEMTQTALKQYDSASPHSNKYKVIQIHEATKQLVAGTLYKIRAEIILSDCPKTDSSDSSVCSAAKEAEPQICNIEVWTRPWIKVDGTETTVKCGGESKTFKTRRSVRDTSAQGGRDDLKDEKSFHSFIAEYNVTYRNSEEMKKRFKIFRSNLRRIQLFNDVELGTGKYGITRFADLTQEEFRRNYLGLKVENRVENEIPFPQAKIPDIELPTEFDWREKGVVTNVKDQGSCGSCWAFSTTGNVEGQYAIKYGKLLEFSEQELVDCDSYDEGCGGGLMDNAYRAIENIGGLELESDYPYDAKNEKCHFNKTLAKVQLSGAVNISQNEDDMAKWLTVNGPISIAINANAMQFYVGGVSHPWKFLCNPKSLDHGVLIVGYGVHSYPNLNKTLPYWLVKNSWGKRWGQQGYYMVYRGDGTCGVNQTPSSGIVA